MYSGFGCQQTSCSSCKYATSEKIYLSTAKFPPIIEDIRIEVSPHFTFHDIEKEIKDASDLVKDVSLLDVYKNKKTFRITYLNRKRNLTNEDVTPVREKIQRLLEKEFKAVIG